MSWTLVWLRPAATLWEKDWLAFLFGDCLKETRDGFHLVDRALVVIQNYNEAFPFIVAYEQSGLRYCLVHISDEGLDATAYAPRCRLIFRNYYHPKYTADPRIVFFPLGYKQGFVPCDRTVAKKYAWSFMGDCGKSDRMKMMEALDAPALRHLDVYRYCFSGFNSPQGLPTATYESILMQSWFAPSPTGNCNSECFRTWEALEAGAVPIVLDASPLIPVPHYYDALVKACGFAQPVPFPVLKQWSDVATAVPWDHPEELRERCLAWWAAFKTFLQANIKKKLQALG